MEVLLFESGNGPACVRFIYDPRFLPGADVALVVSLDRRRILNRWLLRVDKMPPECAGLPSEDVDMTGLFDNEGTCYPDPMAPPEVRLPALPVGDPWFDFRKRDRHHARARP